MVVPNAFHNSTDNAYNGIDLNMPRVFRYRTISIER